MTTIKHSNRLLVFFIGSFLAISSNAGAQPVSVRLVVGAVDLPLSDWSKFSQGIGNSFYSKNNPNPYYALSIHYAIDSHHSVYVGTELVTTSASASDSAIILDWKFQGIPIILGYEYKVLTFNRYFTPVIGAGVSYFISEVKAEEHLSSFGEKRTGDGYGIHASLGLISKLATSLNMITQARYRYSNGMAFSEARNDIKVEFSGFDVSVGLEYFL
jgi:hypothetical protein